MCGNGQGDIIEIMWCAAYTPKFSGLCAVGGLAGDVKAEELKDRFTRAGATVVKAEVMREPATGV